MQLLTIAELLEGKKIDMPQTEGVSIAFNRHRGRRRNKGSRSSLGWLRSDRAGRSYSLPVPLAGLTAEDK